METQEIIEGNKLIAEFMGWKYCYEGMLISHGCLSTKTKFLFTSSELTINENFPKIVHYDYNYGHKCSIPNFEFLYIENGEDEIGVHNKRIKFHSDWNWLMTVVEKIESLNFTTSIYHLPKTLNTVKIFIGGADIVGKNGETKMKAVYKAVVEFIKWYNQNN